MKLVIGLGNPGNKYLNTRHNIGFMAVDLYLKTQGLSAKYDQKFDGEICKTTSIEEKVILLKPSTFMNLSGTSIQKVIHYYDIAIEDILIIVDDVNLDTGKLRLRHTGGHGGHNGLKHIIGTLKTEDFKRIRVGVGYENNMPLDRFVLGKFNEDEMSLITRSIDSVVDAINLFIEGKPFVDIMTIFNTQT